MKSPQTTRRIIEALTGLYPGADTELHYRNAFELLVATMLSAQSTDARVNMVTPALFARFPDAGRDRQRQPGLRTVRMGLASLALRRGSRFAHRTHR